MNTFNGKKVCGGGKFQYVLAMLEEYLLHPVDMNIFVWLYRKIQFSNEIDGVIDVWLYNYNIERVLSATWWIIFFRSASVDEC